MYNHLLETASEQQAQLDSVMLNLREAFSNLSGVAKGRSVLEAQVEEARDLISRASQKIHNVKNSLSGS